MFAKVPIAEAVECNGVTIYEQDVVKIRAPSGIGLVDAMGFGRCISHEYAHHLLQEKHGDTYEGNAIGTNLVHYATNSKKYQYQKRYWSPSFMARYGLPYLKITYFDLKKLTEDRNVIMAEIHGSVAPKGKDIYWR